MPKDAFDIDMESHKRELEWDTFDIFVHDNGFI